MRVLYAARMARNQSSWAASLLICLPALAVADWGPAKRLDAYFDALAADKLANGSVAISVDGQLRYQRSVGFASLNNGVEEPADAGTRYRIDSVTELFTAVLVLQLAEGASITLDTPLAEFFPDVPNALRISYRDLLQRHSGLADYTKAPDFASWRTRPHTRDEMLKAITAAGTRSEPRESFEDCSSEYLLLGYMLEKVLEQPYAAIVRRKISDPLGLVRTYFIGDGKAALESRRYRLTPSGWVERVESDPSVLGGSGGMISSAGDLVRFIDALFAARLVTAHNLEAMQDQETSFGIGLAMRTLEGQTGYGHEGRLHEESAVVYHFPKSGVSIAFTSNAPVLGTIDIVGEVLLTTVDRRHVPKTLTPLKLTAREQEEYAGTWRSAPGRPATGNPFRQFATEYTPLTLALRAEKEGLVARLLDRDYPLKASAAYGFFAPGLGYFLEIVTDRGEMVMRGPDHAYFLKRAE